MSHAEALRLLSGWEAPDADQERLRRRYVEHLRLQPDGLARSCYPDHLTASTLVLSPDGKRVLLTLHSKAGRWFQLGGHVEPGDAGLLAAARREAREESGIDELLLDPAPVQLSEHAVPFCDPRGGVRHLDVRFAALAPTGAAHRASEESLDLAWWPVTELPDPDPDLVHLVALARARLAAAPRGVRGQDASTSSTSSGSSGSSGSSSSVSSSARSPGGGSTSMAADHPSR